MNTEGNAEMLRLRHFVELSFLSLLPNRHNKNRIHNQGQSNKFGQISCLHGVNFWYYPTRTSWPHRPPKRGRVFGSVLTLGVFPTQHAPKDGRVFIKFRLCP